MRRILRLGTSLATAATLIAIGTTAWADGWPQPDKKDWYKRLNVGDSATYELESSVASGTVKTTVTNVEGSMITLETVITPKEGKPQTETPVVDATDPKTTGGQLPAGATVEKGGPQTYRTKRKSYQCTEYIVKAQGATIKAWHSREIPPIFSGGAVFMETEHKGVRSTMKLIVYAPAKKKSK